MPLRTVAVQPTSSQKAPPFATYKWQVTPLPSTHHLGISSTPLMRLNWIVQNCHQQHAMATLSPSWQHNCYSQLDNCMMPGAMWHSWPPISPSSTTTTSSLPDIAHQPQNYGNSTYNQQLITPPMWPSELPYWLTFWHLHMPPCSVQPSLPWPKPCSMATSQHLQD